MAELRKSAVVNMSFPCDVVVPIGAAPSTCVANVSFSGGTYLQLHMCNVVRDDSTAARFPDNSSVFRPLQGRFRRKVPPHTRSRAPELELPGALWLAVFWMADCLERSR